LLTRDALVVVALEMEEGSSGEEREHTMPGPERQLLLLLLPRLHGMSRWGAAGDQRARAAGVPCLQLHVPAKVRISSILGLGFGRFGDFHYAIRFCIPLSFYIV